jgi:hypothetical protein
MLAGVVSMPSNIFATTGTNVSILFLDATNQGDIVLIDASNLGTKVKDGKNQKTLLSFHRSLQNAPPVVTSKCTTCGRGFSDGLRGGWQDVFEICSGAV